MWNYTTIILYVGFKDESYDASPSCGSELLLRRAGKMVGKSTATASNTIILSTRAAPTLRFFHLSIKVIDPDT